MQIDNFVNQPNIRAQMQAEILQAIQTIGTRYGVNFEQAGGTFSAYKNTIRIDAKIVSQEAIDFQSGNLKRFGLYVGLRFPDRKKSLKIIGWDDFSKYSVECEEISTGKKMNYKPSYIRELLQ